MKEAIHMRKSYLLEHILEHQQALGVHDSLDVWVHVLVELLLTLVEVGCPANPMTEYRASKLNDLPGEVVIR